MTRYASALDKTRFWLTIEERGWGVVVVPHTEQREIAEELARQVPGRPAVELNADTDSQWYAPIAMAAATRPAGAFLYLAPGLDKAGRARVFSMLNQQRDRTSMFGVWVLVVSLTQHEEARRHAGDLVSVFSSFERVSFVPRELSDDELVAARAELHAYYQKRFGRLDLRGFIRSEQEDVSFAVEDIFQPLTAVPTASASATKLELDLSPELLRRGRGGFALIELLAAQTTGVSLVVGGPGAGKSFFARWCALAGSRDEQFLGRERAIPLYLPLAVTRIQVEMPALEAYIVDAFLEAGLTIAHAIAREAAAGRVVFLLDGLDEVGSWRAAMVEATGALARRYPQARFVVTSRPTGLDGLAFDARRHDLQGLDDAPIVALLTAWCELYEIQRAGPDGRTRGRDEGERLGREVIASPTMSELARVPLLATIIAIVHRAGVRLPDHRVELYEHIVRILVERWNQLRSRDADLGAPVIRAPDAIRLLGPVAYDMVANGRDGAIDESALRSLIARQLKRGTIRGIADADEALDVFRNSLGLLVEQAPGVYSFMHKTLGEFLAAHEAVRTGALETLLAPPTAFSPAWREVLLLALGIVGTVQANDDRLRAAVLALLEQARSNASDGVSALLGGILADDPSLPADLADRLCDALGTAEATSIARSGPMVVQGHVYRRILRGPWQRQLADRLVGVWGSGPGRRLDLSESFRWWNAAELLNAHGDLAGALLCELAVASTGLWHTISVPLALAEHDRIVLAVPERLGLRAWFHHGLGGLLLASCQAEGDTLHFEPIELHGDDLVVPVPQHRQAWLRARGPIRPLIQFSEFFRDLTTLQRLLTVWREVAAAHGGPAPPATPEEAIARYAPTATAE